MGSSNNQFKNHNFMHSLISALKGICYAFKTERNLKIDLVVLIALCISIKILKFNIIEIVICNLNWFLLISAEIFNTVIEHLSDKIWGSKFDQDVKIIKDMAAGAVLILAIVLILNVIIISFTKLSL
ncbi:MAG: diacylglycerol kinase [Bombilactobacillus mellifer]|nr:diacylglycerol kinase [Bombilactobacillus mellifer]